MSRRRPLVLSPGEIGYLKGQWLAGASALDIAADLGRSVTVIRRVAGEQGLPRRCADRWTEAEDQVLRDHAGHCTAVELVARLPGRTIHGIKRRADRLGIAIHCDRRLFTEAEDALIRARYGGHRVRDWAHLLPGRTAGHIINRARILGLRSDLAGFRAGVPRLDKRVAAKCLRQPAASSGEARRPGSVLRPGPIHSRGSPP